MGKIFEYSISLNKLGMYQSAIVNYYGLTGDDITEYNTLDDTGYFPLSTNICYKEYLEIFQNYRGDIMSNLNANEQRILSHIIWFALTYFSNNGHFVENNDEAYDRMYEKCTKTDILNLYKLFKFRDGKKLHTFTIQFADSDKIIIDNHENWIYKMLLEEFFKEYAPDDIPNNPDDIKLPKESPGRYRPKYYSFFFGTTTLLMQFTAHKTYTVTMDSFLRELMLLGGLFTKEDDVDKSFNNMYSTWYKSKDEWDKYIIQRSFEFIDYEELKNSGRHKYRKLYE